MSKAGPACLVGILCVLSPLTSGSAFAQLRAQVHVSGLSQPLGFVQDPADSTVQYVVEQGGRIRVVRNGTLLSADFLNLSAAITSGGERGLLGLAFPPDYATSGRFFVDFTDLNGNTVVARFKRSAVDRLVADPASRFDLLWPSGLRFIEQPFANHNGGHLAFGPDGHLYVGMGDGGSANDPGNLAQNPQSLLGKMLRIDVGVPDTDPRGYRVPPDNPFLSGSPIAALGEIWAFGLRNPWQFSFDDPARGGTGALVIADVGQNSWEEVDYEPAGHGGRNYGWRNREGAHPNVTSLPPAYLPLTDPTFEYSHADGVAITGGFVYRGLALGPQYRGRYFFADFGLGRVWSLGLRIESGTGEAAFVDQLEHTSELGGTATLGAISSIGVDAGGELYLVNYSAGTIVRVTIPDADGDGLPDWWESRFGLDPNSAAGVNGAAGDPDGDGQNNWQEYQAGTHPRGFFTRYFAEGAVSAFFDVSFALLNPSQTAAASVLLRYEKDDGTASSQFVAVPPLTRRTAVAKDAPSMIDTSFSTIIESDQPIVTDRTMTWDADAYGAHAETGIEAPATTWYLAEGATHSGFQLYYLIQNPNAAAAAVRVTYLLPAPAPPVVKTYTVNPGSRFTIFVNGEDPRLAATDVSAVLTSTNSQPIVVERAMYLDAGGQFFGAGHDGAGVTAPATVWYLAEGATGSFFDMFVLIANPGSAPASITAAYLLPSGAPVLKSYTVPGNSRYTIWVNAEDPRLADTAVSTEIRSTNGVPVIVERAMWWPGPTPATWFEAHNSAGATRTSTLWALAEGEEGGPREVSTYILIANLSSVPGSARVTIVFEDGSTTEKTFALAPRSRFNVEAGTEFPLANGRRFGAIVESLGASPADLVVERAMYWNARGVVWAAGTDALGTRLR